MKYPRDDNNQIIPGRKPYPLISDFGEARLEDEKTAKPSTNIDYRDYYRQIDYQIVKETILSLLQKSKQINCQSVKKTILSPFQKSNPEPEKTKEFAARKSVKGTKLFMAEEMRSQNYGQKVDIYALVLSYYQCKNYNPAQFSPDSVERETYENQYWNPKDKIKVEEEVIEKFSYSPKKNLAAWKDFLKQGTHEDPELRPTASDISRNLTSKNLAVFLDKVDLIGINPRKNRENYHINFFAKIVLPFVMFCLAIYFALVWLVINHNSAASFLF